MKYYNVHEDGGHGWLEVEKSEIMATPVKITPYSYQDKYNVYLEEDCDKWTFLSYLESKGKDFRLNTIYHKADAPMRAMRRFSKGA
jgi:hypothetical protein